MSYRITKISRPREERRNNKKTYKIQFYSYIHGANIPEPLGAHFLVSVPINTTNGHYGNALVSIPNCATSTYLQAVRTTGNTLNGMPFRMFQNQRRVSAINMPLRARSGHSPGNFLLDFDGERQLQRVRDSAGRRKLPHRQGNFHVGHQLIFINPQWIHILASLIPLFSSDDPSINFQAALLTTYLYGDQPGFPNLFQAFEVALLNDFQEYQLWPINNPDIDMFNVHTNTGENVYANHVDFNQPFPPALHGWEPSTETLDETEEDELENPPEPAPLPFDAITQEAEAPEPTINFTTEHQVVAAFFALMFLYFSLTGLLW